MLSLVLVVIVTVVVMTTVVVMGVSMTSFMVELPIVIGMVWCTSFGVCRLFFGFVFGL